ncbi:MAG TPA: FecR domain-containing protein [Chitinophaga sp.]
MQENTFRELLDKYLTGRMTELEWKEFSSMLNDPVYKNLLEGVIDTELQEHSFEGAPDKEMLAMIQHNLRDSIRAKKRSGMIIALFKKAALATVVLIIAGAGYWWLTSKSSKKELANVKPATKETVIPPGGNKAILKLGNGDEIMLDSAGEGTLAQQGPAKVMKLANGQLSYKLSDKEHAAIVYNTITTPRGGQYRLTLADGTNVWLNAASSLQYPAAFSGKTRRVVLTGEGYFEVAKNASMPFHVQVNSMEVEVLGTHFNINSYANELAIRTTLLEGSVRVRDGRQVRRLKSGQQSSFIANGELKVLDNADLEEAVAWKNGMFQFKAADIETVLRQAERWYDVQFDYKGGIAARFSGQISRSANAEQLLKILEFTGKVKFEIHGKTIVVKQ